MSRHRLPARGSKYYVDPLLYSFSVDYVKMYPAWKKELAKDLPEDRRKDLESRLDIIQSAAAEAAPDDVMRDFLLKGVCEDLSFIDLVGIPCERKMYYRIRRRFYFAVAARIK